MQLWQRRRRQDPHSFSPLPRRRLPPSLLPPPPSPGGAFHQKEILAFPCNQFGAQEPAGNAQIKRFAQSKGAKYPLFAKIDVNGNNAHPLYKWLKSQKGTVFGIEVPVKWNFEKFLVGKDGKVIDRYLPTTSPQAIVPDIEKAL